jgi:hypothetical protein
MSGPLKTTGMKQLDDYRHSIFYFFNYGSAIPFPNLRHADCARAVDVAGGSVRSLPSDPFSKTSCTVMHRVH